MRKEFELISSLNIESKNTVFKASLPIDEDTSFDIYYDIYDSRGSKYLYIKLVENTAVAPFYYNRSYEKEELENIDCIFKAVTMEKLKEDLRDLFNNKKIRLFYGQNKDKIKMALTCNLFQREYTINFELYREMTPEDRKEAKMNTLYDINKKKQKIKKEFYSYLKTINNMNKDIIQKLVEKMDLEVLNDEDEQINQINNNALEEIIINDVINNENIIENENPPKFKDEKMKKIFNIKANLQIEKDPIKNLYYCWRNFKNITDYTWEKDSIKFKCEENSAVKCVDIEYPIFDIEKNQDGEFKFFIDNITTEKPKISFKIFFEGKELEDTRLIFKLIKYQ